MGIDKLLEGRGLLTSDAQAFRELSDERHCDGLEGRKVQFVEGGRIGARLRL